MTNVQENRVKIITFVILVGTSIFALADILLDIKERVPFDHLVHEAALWMFSMIGAFYQFKIIKWQNKEMAGFQQQISDLDQVNLRLKKEQENFIYKFLFYNV